MAKSITIKDLFIKLSNIFKTDMYIINNSICIGGKESENRTSSSFMCFLNQDMIELVKETYKTEKTIFISDVKKEKANFHSHVSFIELDDDRKIQLEKMEKLIKTVPMWSSFQFSDEEKNSIFIECNLYTLFEGNKPFPELVISKSLLPLFTEDNINDALYYVHEPKEDNELYSLIINLDYPFFQMYNIIEYISTENKEERD